MRRRLCVCVCVCVQVCVALIICVRASSSGSGTHLQDKENSSQHAYISVHELTLSSRSGGGRRNPSLVCQVDTMNKTRRSGEGNTRAYSQHIQSARFVAPMTVTFSEGSN
jgi:hypothetical protein